jgi:hypothetical protein
MNEAKTKTIGTKVAPAVYDALQQIAAVQRRTVAEVVREMIDETLTRWAENVGAFDPADVIHRLEKLEQVVAKSAEAAAEARYFARLSAMYGIDVAHYVAQKVELGVVPTPPDKVQNQKLLAMYERKSREFRADYLAMEKQQG